MSEFSGELFNLQETTGYYTPFLTPRTMFPQKSWGILTKKEENQMEKSVKTSFPIAVVVILALLTVFVGTAVGAENVIKWRFQAYVTAGSTHYIESAIGIADEIRKRTNGRLDIQVFGSGSLLPDKEIAQGVKRGMLEMGMSNAAYFTEDTPLAAIAGGLPFAVAETWEWAYIMNHMGFEKMFQEELARQGLYYHSGMMTRGQLALKKPVRKTEDFKGLKLRSSGIMQRYFTSIGAAATYLPGTEIYPALASGVIDGSHWGAVQGNTDIGSYEVCKYHLNVCLFVSSGDGYIINQKSFEKLPKDIRDIVVGVLGDHFGKRRDSYLFQEVTTLSNNVKKYGTIVLTLPDEEHAKMVKAAMPLWDEAAKKSASCAKAIDMIKEFNRKMGRLQ
jgi:TRAP-type C4-dicarboxylate transport system substrate-binding protein